MSLLLFLKHNYRFFPVSLEERQEEVSALKKRRKRKLKKVVNAPQEVFVEPPSLAPMVTEVIELQRMERLKKRKRSNINLFALYRMMFDE